MSDLKLFRLDGQTATEIHGTSLALERTLQGLIERNLENLLGVRFLASEFSTGKEHGGRMDTLGIDENGCPVIVEYKRSSNMNVINQGLFYLDWLVTHRGDFEMLVLKTLGQQAAEAVEWSSPRLICIAGAFNKFDEHAIKQMNRNIELIRYMKFDDDLLLLDQINAVSVIASRIDNSDSSTSQTLSRPPAAKMAGKSGSKTVTDYLNQASPDLKERYEMLREYLENLGDDVQWIQTRLVARKASRVMSVKSDISVRVNWRLLLLLAPISNAQNHSWSKATRTLDRAGNRSRKATLSGIQGTKMSYQARVKNGKIGEVLIELELLKQDWHVERLDGAAKAVNGDLIAIRGQRRIVIQVKSALSWKRPSFGHAGPYLREGRRRRTYG